MLEKISEFLMFDPKLTVAIAVPFLTFLLNRWFSPRAKLFHSERHRFHYIVQQPLLDAQGSQIQPTQSVVVSSLSLTNAGRVPATNVEITFNWKPQYFNVWPVRPYEERAHPDGRFTVILNSLAPKEVFGMELLSVNLDLPNLINLRSNEAESCEKRMVLQILYPIWIYRLILSIFVLGFMTTVYIILYILDFALS